MRTGRPSAAGALAEFRNSLLAGPDPLQLRRRNDSWFETVRKKADAPSLIALLMLQSHDSIQSQKETPVLISYTRLFCTLRFSQNFQH